MNDHASSAGASPAGRDVMRRARAGVCRCLAALVLLGLAACAAKQPEAASLTDREKALTDTAASQANAALGKAAPRTDTPPEGLLGAALAIDDYLYKEFFASNAKLYGAVRAAEARLTRAQTRADSAQGDALTTARAELTEAAKAASQAKEDTAFKALAAREMALTGAREHALTALGKITGNGKPTGIAEQFASSDAYRRVRDRLVKLNTLFNSLAAANAVDVLTGEHVNAYPDLARDAGVTLLGNETLDELRAEVARSLNAHIKDSFEIWAPHGAAATKDPPLSKKMEDMVSGMLVFNHPGDIPMSGKPYAPLGEQEKATFTAKLRVFALRYPDGGVATAVTEAGKWEAAQAEKRAGAPPLLARLGTHASGLPEREVVRLIVEDLRTAYGDVPPARSLRRNLVGVYSAETGLVKPEPVALAMAIFGSVVLFGGLALAIYRASRSGKMQADTV